MRGMIRLRRGDDKMIKRYLKEELKVKE